MRIKRYLIGSLLVVALGACGQTNEAAVPSAVSPTDLPTIAPTTPATSAADPISTPAPTPAGLAPLLAFAPPPDRPRSEVAPGSLEWYSAITISPTLGLLWAGASNPANIAESLPVQAVALDGHYALTSVGSGDTPGDLLVLDLSDPAAPVQRAHLPGLGFSNARMADPLVVTTSGAAIQLIDLGDPLRPAPRGRIDLPGQIAGLALSAGRVYATTAAPSKATTGVLSVIDVRDPDRPALLGSLPTDTAGPAGVEVVDTLVYVAEQRGLLIIDAAEPAAMRIVGRAPIENADAVAVGGRRAYVSSGARLVILDLNDPAGPTVLGSYTEQTTLPISDLSVDGERVYLTLANWGSSDSGGLRVLDVAEPGQPKLIAGYLTESNAIDLDRSGGLIAVANGRRGLLILRPPAV